MTIAQLEAFYERHIKQLAEEDQRRLIAIVTRRLASSTREDVKGKHSVLEFAGAGKDNPIGMDAQAYISQLRDEWEHRT